jgi:hypothetical protein
VADVASPTAQWEPPADDFAAWLGSPLVRVSLIRQHDQWYAVAKDFGIAGVGPTQQAARASAASVLLAYLRACHADGRPFEQTLRRRPIFPPGRLTFVRFAQALTRGLAEWLPGRRGVLKLPTQPSL